MLLSGWLSIVFPRMRFWRPGTLYTLGFRVATDDPALRLPSLRSRGTGRGEYSTFIQLQDAKGSAPRPEQVPKELVPGCEAVQQIFGQAGMLERFLPRSETAHGAQA